MHVLYQNQKDVKLYKYGVVTKKKGDIKEG